MMGWLVTQVFIFNINSGACAFPYNWSCGPYTITYCKPANCSASTEVTTGLANLQRWPLREENRRTQRKSTEQGRESTTNSTHIWRNRIGTFVEDEYSHSCAIPALLMRYFLRMESFLRRCKSSCFSCYFRCRRMRFWESLLVGFVCYSTNPLKP